MNSRSLDRRAFVTAASAFGGLALISSRAEGAVRVFASELGPVVDSPRVLLLVQLTGGNDGLSTIVPFGDDAYYAARPSLALAKKDVLAFDDYKGLHGSLVGLRKVFDGGKLAIVEGVGYPNPVRSHFKSYEIWHTADVRGRVAGEGWIGKLGDVAWSDGVDPNLVVHVGANVPYSLESKSHPAVAFVNPASYRWAGAKEDLDAYGKMGEDRAKDEKPIGEKDANLDYLRRVVADARASSQKIRAAVAHYTTTIEYPDDALGGALRDVAALANGGLGTRVLSVELSGFDTHTNQRNRHDQLMRQLDRALAALIADLERSDAGKNVVGLVFSEFGRRVKENGSRGTDHGVAAPVFVFGSRVKGGLYGKHPSLDDLDAGDLRHSVDFRSVYATLIERWIGVESAKVLGASYPTIPFLA
ncbi:MAG: DUF1501 domain-containing protein [Planctomycetes bacterium]|nr:DUF1501 domain-containing protein [Planctomycetota bacterium]